MSPTQYQSIFESKKIKVVAGDLTLPRLGLSEDTIAELRCSTQVIIHSASSINLRKSLPQVATTILDPSLALAEIALECPHLEHMAYISTAYANTHLHMLHSGTDTFVSEQIHPLRSNGGDTTAFEIEDLQRAGTTPEYQFHKFPFPYAYAKHLTERALISLFAQHGKSDKLLIVRPSIIGPALRDPYPYYEIRGSAPATSWLAAVVTSPSLCITFCSRFADPARQSNIDEVPVDVVVNRIMMHISHRSSGVVHAVAGQRGRRSFENMWAKAMTERRIPWRPSVSWRDVDWDDGGLHLIAKAFKIVGTSFLFEDVKVYDVWNKMSDADKAAFPLFLESPEQSGDVCRRREDVRKQVEKYFRKKKWPGFVVGFLLHNLIHAKV